jgi:RNA polymerase-binding transcription factor DksA
MLKQNTMSEKKKITQKIKELEQHKHEMLYSNHPATDADMVTQAVNDTEYEIMVLLERLEMEKNLSWFRYTLYAASAVILGAFIYVVLTR